MRLCRRENGARQKQNWFKHPPCAKVRSIGWQKLPGPRSLTPRELRFERYVSRMIMTKKHRIGIVLGLIWFLVRVLDHYRRTFIQAHHRISRSPTDDHSLANLADAENTAPYDLEPRNFGDRD